MVHSRACVQIRVGQLLQVPSIWPRLVIFRVSCIRENDLGLWHLARLDQAISQIEHDPFKGVWCDVAFPPAGLFPANGSGQVEVWANIGVVASNRPTNTIVYRLP